MGGTPSTNTGARLSKTHTTCTPSISTLHIRNTGLVELATHCFVATITRSLNLSYLNSHDTKSTDMKQSANIYFISLYLVITYITLVPVHMVLSGSNTHTLCFCVTAGTSASVNLQSTRMMKLQKLNSRVSKISTEGDDVSIKAADVFFIVHLGKLVKERSSSKEISPQVSACPKANSRHP